MMIFLDLTLCRKFVLSFLPLHSSFFSQSMSPSYVADTFLRVSSTSYLLTYLLTYSLTHSLPYSLTYLLTPGCRVLEKLPGLQLVKKFPAFHGTRRFITALTSVCHLSLSWASPIQSIYPPPGDPS